MPDLSIVIPAYNEEKNIRNSLERILIFLAEQSLTGEIIVVDDGSSDKTADLVESFAKDNPQVKLQREAHRGKGAAVRSGVLSAVGDFILFTDADLAVDIKEYKRLAVWLNEQGYDLAIGSREGLGAVRRHEPFYRHLMGRVFNLSVKIFVLRGFEDTQCGFKLFKKEAAKDIFSRLVTYGEKSPEIVRASVTAFDVEVLFLAKKLGYKIKEVPVEWEHVKTRRVHPVKDSVRMFLDILRIRYNSLRGLYK